MYAHVTNGTVDHTTATLPRVWRRPDRTVTVGFHRLDAAAQRDAGWYPIDDQRPTLAEGEQWGPPEYTVGAETVALTAAAVAAPEPTGEQQAIAALVAVSAALGADAITRSTVLGDTLTDHAADLLAALDAMPVGANARPAIQIIVDAILTAAIPEDP